MKSYTEQLRACLQELLQWNYDFDEDDPEQIEKFNPIADKARTLLARPVEGDRIVTADEISKAALERFPLEPEHRAMEPVHFVTKASLQINHKLAFIEGAKWAILKPPTPPQPDAGERTPALVKNGNHKLGIMTADRFIDLWKNPEHWTDPINREEILFDLQKLTQDQSGISFRELDECNSENDTLKAELAQLKSTSGPTDDEIDLAAHYFERNFPEMEADDGFAAGCKWYKSKTNFK